MLVTSEKCNGLEEAIAGVLDCSAVVETEGTISLTHVGTTISLTKIKESKCINLNESSLSKLVLVLFL